MTLVDKICEDLGLDSIEDFSDGYHTFKELYHQRAVLFATIVNQNPDISWKSWKHEDGEYCFDSDGEWFIVGIDTPKGEYTYHYQKEYWDMFKCKELPTGKHWDGHDEKDVTRLLSITNNSIPKYTGGYIYPDPNKVIDTRESGSNMISIEIDNRNLYSNYAKFRNEKLINEFMSETFGVKDIKYKDKTVTVYWVNGETTKFDYVIDDSFGMSKVDILETLMMVYGKRLFSFIPESSPENTINKWVDKYFEEKNNNSNNTE